MTTMTDIHKILFPRGGVDGVDSPSVVECFGTPGSGKTFVATELLAQLRRDKVNVSSVAMEIGAQCRVYRVLAKMKLVFLGGALRYSRLIPIIRLVLLHRPFTSWTSLRVFFNWLYITSLINSQQRYSPLVLLDQGIAQAVWSTVFYSSQQVSADKSAFLVSRLLNSMNLRSVLVMEIIASEDVILERLRNRARGSSPLDRDLDQLPQALSATRSAAVILDHLTRSEKFRVVQFPARPKQARHLDSVTCPDGGPYV
jgi:hypothetical protein